MMSKALMRLLKKLTTENSEDTEKDPGLFLQPWTVLRLSQSLYTYALSSGQ